MIISWVSSNLMKESYNKIHFLTLVGLPCTLPELDLDYCWIGTFDGSSLSQVHENFAQLQTNDGVGSLWAWVRVPK